MVAGTSSSSVSEGQVRKLKPGSERDRPVNFEGSVNQRFREFWREISGCGRYLEGPFRTPKVLVGDLSSSVPHRNLNKHGFIDPFVALLYAVIYSQADIGHRCSALRMAKLDVSGEMSIRIVRLKDAIGQPSFRKTMTSAEFFEQHESEIIDQIRAACRYVRNGLRDTKVTDLST